jgi:hypothetical protein
MYKKLITTLIAGTAILLTVSATAVEAASAAPAVTVTQRVIFNGTSDTPDGPEGQTSVQKPYDKPETITTTNDGTLEEDVNLGPYTPCAKNCGEWWYNTSAPGVYLTEFYWDYDGDKVFSTAAQAPANDNSAWYQWKPGVYTPLCLEWNPGGAEQFIKLDTTDWKWSKATQADPGTCPV